MKRGISKILLLVLLVVILVLSGCTSNRNRCTSGDACVYFQGTEGIRMRQENRPHTLYYHSNQITDPEANSVEFNLKLENVGPSYAFGAAFIEGFDPNLFRLYKLENGQYMPINVPTAQGACFFDLLGFGAGGLGFIGICGGIGGQFTGGGNWGANINLQQFGLQWFNDPNWPQITLNFNQLASGNFNIGVGYNGNLFNVMGYGQYLMALTSGIDFASWGGSEFALHGDNPDFPGGDIDYKSFKVQMWTQWPAGQDYVRVPYQLKTCYAYTTFVAPMICVDPNPYSEEEKVCRSETYTWGGSQGAPVAVTRLEQVNTGSEVLLDFTIRNVGRGRVWDVGKLAACSPYYPGRGTGNMHNVVYLGPAYIGNTRIDCSRWPSVRLDPNTGEARFTCRYPFSQGAADIGSGYATPLKMELWYGYEEIIPGTLTLRRLG
jgi:hypothetical protein